MLWIQLHLKKKRIIEWNVHFETVEKIPFEFKRGAIN